MDIRHPVRTLQWALMRALEHDLAGVPSAAADALLRAQSAAPLTRRPTEAECSVLLFSQAWTCGELDFAARRTSEPVAAETVVITGPEGDACVYVSMHLLYRIAHPNRRFFLDVAAQRMRARARAADYEGLDAGDLQAFDYEVAAALARVCGAAQRLATDDAARAARVLSASADTLRALANRRAATRLARLALPPCPSGAQSPRSQRGKPEMAFE